MVDVTHEHAAPAASGSSLHVVSLTPASGWQEPAQRVAMHAPSSALAGSVEAAARASVVHV